LGCDVVSVLAGGGDAGPGPHPLVRRHHPDDLRLMVAEAHRLGLKTAAHVQGADTPADTPAGIAGLGFDSLEDVSFLARHGSGVRRRALDEIASRGTYVTVPAGLLPGHRSFAPEEAARREALGEVVAGLVASGARIVPGSDSGVSAAKAHGVYPYTLMDLVRLGMPNLDVLHAATRVAAEAVGWGMTKGALRAGADADIVVLGSSPLYDIGAVTDVLAVYRSGERVR
ncbi:amidohydrolase family protein, partial [Streptomyces sp. S6]